MGMLIVGGVEMGLQRKIGVGIETQLWQLYQVGTTAALAE